MKIFSAKTLAVTSLLLATTSCDDTSYFVRFLNSKILKPFTLTNDAGTALKFQAADYVPEPEPTDEIDAIAVPGINHTGDLGVCESGAAQSQLKNDLFFVISGLERQPAGQRELNSFAVETLENTPLCRPFAQRLVKINELLTGNRPTVPAPKPPTPIEPTYVITGVNLDLKKRKPEIKLSTSGGMITLKTNLSKKDLKEALSRNKVYIPKDRTGKNIAVNVQNVPGTWEYDSNDYTYETSCQDSYTETHCEWIDRERVCRDVTIYVPGTQEVTVTTTTSAEDFTLTLQKDNKSVAEVVFNLEEENTYRRTSTCVADYPPHHGGGHHGGWGH
ncbi:MAG: hypothetical protein HRU19_24675 [Pseudobacteriovorax sp.]|nr:hypothetical protein [Pseudobacteriovorax sp.]